MKKITKAQVKSIIKKEGRIRVAILPCKANPYSVWYNPTTVEFDNIEKFENFVNSFIYYNCTWETGYYPSYYID